MTPTKIDEAEKALFGKEVTAASIMKVKNHAAKSLETKFKEVERELSIVKRSVHELKDGDEDDNALLELGVPSQLDQHETKLKDASFLDVDVRKAKVAILVFKVTKPVSRSM